MSDGRRGSDLPGDGPHVVRTGILLAILAYTAWGLLAPVAKILLATWEPMSLNAVRMVLATALLAAMIPADARREGLRYLRKKEVVLLTLLGAGINFTIYLYSLTFVDATFAVLGFYTAPLWTAVLAAWFLRERIGWWFAPAVVLLGIGAWLALTGTAGAPTEGFHALGMSLAVLSGLGWAIYTVGLRRYAPGLRLRPLMFAGFLVATVYFLIGAVLVEGWTFGLDQSAAQWGWMSVHVMLPTTAALILFNASLQRAPAAAVNILIGVELVATVLFSWWLLGDTFDGVQMAGLGLVLASVSGYLWLRGKGASPAGE